MRNFAAVLFGFHQIPLFSGSRPGSRARALGPGPNFGPKFIYGAPIGAPIHISGTNLGPNLIMGPLGPLFIYLGPPGPLFIYFGPPGGPNYLFIYGPLWALRALWVRPVVMFRCEASSWQGFVSRALLGFCSIAHRCSRAACLLYTSPSPRDQRGARMPSSA